MQRHPAEALPIVNGRRIFPAGVLQNKALGEGLNTE
eukprot:CAMPEP_0117682006 /NCGR_PEP_ID=MMETSP0804-20121206/19356_1 /TAXON_ID=1074897 /ORGANISM="Tetraselmis astigmatica, Strain CCMP880" /LENGTH=35 /DNA_ID= /DNA_START= /DNA_END= /DNA_ORIENTATION=